jgi:hypothetical protein
MIADTIADAFRTVANITGDLMLVALFDRLRSLPESGDGVTIVPRAEALQVRFEISRSLFLVVSLSSIPTSVEASLSSQAGARWKRAVWRRTPAH